MRLLCLLLPFRIIFTPSQHSKKHSRIARKHRMRILSEESSSQRMQDSTFWLCCCCEIILTTHMIGLKLVLIFYCFKITPKMIRNSFRDNFHLPKLDFCVIITLQSLFLFPPTTSNFLSQTHVPCRMCPPFQQHLGLPYCVSGQNHNSKCWRRRGDASDRCKKSD